MMVLPAIPLSALKKPLEDLYEAAKDSVKTKLKRLNAEARIKEIYRSVTDVQKVKTMWRIEKEVKLLTFYYPSKVVVDKIVKTISTIAEISDTQRFVIQGTVGQGKSIFLRYLCIRELTAARRIPIFLELRRYERTQPFKAFLIAAIEAYRIPCDDEVFEYLADSGRLVLLLDAFDEVDPDAVPHVLTEIESLAQRFPKLQVVVTARPDCGIERSPHFRVYQLAPLNPADHKPFLEKIVDDQAKAREILTAITKSGAQIASLLTTPLLLTLVVIIYNATQEIPASLSEFYEALFHTLLTRHDRTKPGFRRKRSTTLSDSELKKLFEAFCYATRQRDQLVLTESAASEMLTRASAITGISCKPEPFLNEITKVACLMQQEGFEYHFIHKSVAEFHAASFIKNTSEANAHKFYDAVKDYKWQKWRQELEFLAQIDRVRYLRYLFVPSSLQALAEFGVAKDEDSEPSREQVLKILNRIEVMRVQQPQEPIPATQLQFSFGNLTGFVPNSLTMEIFRHAAPHAHAVAAPDKTPWAAPRKLGELIERSPVADRTVEWVRQVVGTARSKLAEAEEELKLQARVGDFVSP